MRFHIEIETSAGNIIGSMFADRPISVRKDSIVSIQMMLNFSGLAPDRYIFHVVAETLESFESYTWQDTVFHACVIEVIEDPECQRISTWNTKTWGNVRLENAVVGKQNILNDAG